jgi:hypothetical protein
VLSKPLYGNALFMAISKKRPVVTVVIGCTDRKSVAAQIRLREIQGIVDPEERLSAWLAKVRSSSSEKVAAKELYQGDSWRVLFRPAYAQQFNYRCSLAIASAGYGLIDPEERLVSYSATFSVGKPDSIKPLKSPSSYTREWWNGLIRRREADGKGVTSIWRLSRENPESIQLLVLSASYLRAMEDDITQARDALSRPDLLMIVSAGCSDSSPLKDNLIPCDARLCSRFRGVRGSLNHRIARYILSGDAKVPLILGELRTHFSNLLASQPPIVGYDRKPLSDYELGQWIKRLIERNPKVSYTSGLRILRHSGFACEQERFRNQFLFSNSNSNR